MALLNYTTTVPAERTAGEVIAKLAKAGAQQMFTATIDGLLCKAQDRPDWPPTRKGE